MTHRIFLSLLFLSLLLSACQTGLNPSPTLQIVTSTINVVQATEVVSTTEVSPALSDNPLSGAYPAPGYYPAPGAYPAPQTEINTESSVQSTAISSLLKPYTLETAKPGTTILHGLLLVTDPMISRPEAEDAIFLVPLIGEGVISIPPFVAGEVPQAQVDETTGEFVFKEITPGNYAVVVLTVGGAQIPARFNKDNNFAIIRVEESDLGQTIELDYLVI